MLLSKAQIETALDFNQIEKAITEAFVAVSQGQVNLPPVGHIAFPEAQADCHIKYGHIKGEEDFVVKIAAGFPQNANCGLPTGNGLSLVLSATTGEIKAILHDEMMLTDVRTAIASAIATKTLSHPSAKCVLIVGTGVQAKRQVEAYERLMPHRFTFSVWGRNNAAARRLIQDTSDIAHVELATDLKAACQNSQIIVTATGATKAFISAEWIQPRTLVCAVGADAPGKQELTSILAADAEVLIADLKSQCLDHGELARPFQEGLIKENQVLELGHILSGAVCLPKRFEGVRLCDLTGIAAQDIAIAQCVMNVLEQNPSRLNQSATVALI